MGRMLRALKKRMPIRSLQRRDMSVEGAKTIENVDAGVQFNSPDKFPPNYVKDDDPLPRR
jgi:hypothetical protein